MEKIRLKQTFGITAESRETLLQYLENHAPEHLNKVPQGFNNDMEYHPHYGFEINAFKDAINFSDYHKGVNTGALMAI